jgi:hypothetical protein
VPETGVQLIDPYNKPTKEANKVCTTDRHSLHFENLKQDFDPILDQSAHATNTMITVRCVNILSYRDLALTHLPHWSKENNAGLIIFE